LLAAWRDESGLKLVRARSAPDLLERLNQHVGQVILVDDDLHLLDAAAVAQLGRSGLPVVALARDPGIGFWRASGAIVLSWETAAAEIAATLIAAAAGDQVAARPAITQPKWVMAPHGGLQVIAFWPAPGAPGATTFATSSAAILSAVQKTVLVDLNTTGAAVAAQLDAGGHVRQRRTLLDVVAAAPGRVDDHEGWLTAVRSSVQPAPSLGPQASVLYGVPQPERRSELSTVASVAPLIDALREDFPFVLLDLGSGPVHGSSIEAQVTATALQHADQVLFVTTPDQAGLHRATMALREAGSVLDLERTAVLLNHWDRRFHEPPPNIEVRLGLPIVAVVPEDRVAAQRALRAGRPVVGERDSRMRKPLLDLLDRVVVAGQVTLPADHPWREPSSLWSRLRGALAAVPASLWGGSL
jgi:MinD-like ATPase involved in chromosome partitioning or flagellar assembly